MDFNEYKALNIRYMRRGRSRIYVGKMYAIVLGIAYISLLGAIQVLRQVDLFCARKVNELFLIFLETEIV